MLQNICSSIRIWRRFLTFLIYLLIPFGFFVCWEDAYTPKGYGKETTDQEKGMRWALEMHKLVIEILTFLTAPGFPLALCQDHDYRVSASALPAAECSNFFIISGVIFSLHHDDTWAEIFRGRCKQRMRIETGVNWELLNSGWMELGLFITTKLRG